MATPPTLVTTYEVVSGAINWDGANTPKTVSVTTQTGDYVVVMAASEDASAHTWVAPTLTGVTTFSLAQENDNNGDAGAACWWGLVTTGGTNTLSMGVTGTKYWGARVLVWRDSDGIGNSVKSVAAGSSPSLALTTGFDNSAIAFLNADFAAVDGASRVYRTINSITPVAGGAGEVRYFRDAAKYTAYIATYSDAGTAGSKTTGMTAPSTQDPSTIAIEIKGSASGGATLYPAPAFTWGTVNSGASSTSVAVNMPAPSGGILAGGLLALVVAYDQAAAPTTPSGWTLLEGGATSTTSSLWHYVKFATGGDTVTVALTTATDYVMICGYAAPGTHGVRNLLRDIRFAATAGTGTTAAANPPATISRGVALNWTAIATCVIDYTATGGTLSASPAGYTNVTRQVSASSTTSVALGVATLALSAAITADPGTYTNTNRAWRAQTLLIPPYVEDAETGFAVTVTDWTGSNGAAWPSPWASTDLTSGTTATINTNRGRVVTSAVGGYADHGFLTEATGIADSDVVCDFVCVAVTEAYQRLVARADASVLACYYAEIEWDSNGFLAIGEANGSGTVTHAFQFAMAPTVATVAQVWHVRFRCVGGAYMAKFWVDSELEPMTWTAYATDATLTTGRTAVQVVAGNAAAAKTIDFDNYVRRLAVAEPNFTNTAPGRGLVTHIAPTKTAMVRGSRW